MALRHTRLGCIVSEHIQCSHSASFVTAAALCVLDPADSLWDILWQAVPDEAHKTRAFSQTVPVLGGRTADTVGKWTAFAGVVNTCLMIQGNLRPSL